MIRRFAAGALLAWMVTVMVAPPATAHSGSGSVGPSNYLTELTEIEPAVDGVRVRVLDLGDRLELTNASDDDVVVLGYEDEPYLKVGPGGVFENRLSSATYVNADRQATTDIPEEVDAKADPEWRKVSDGRTVRWHDHRAHWMGSEDPPAVDADRSRRHVIFDRWEVPIVVAGTKVTVAGTLTWSPAPSPWAWLAIAAAVSGVGLGAFFALRRHRVGVLAVAVCVAAVVGILQTAGLSLAPNQAGSAGVRFAATAVYPAMGWIAGVVGVRLLAKGRPDGIYIAMMAGAVALLVGGLQDVSSLARAHTPFLWDSSWARLAVATNLGVGVAVLAMCAVLRPRQAVRAGVIR